MPAATHTLGLTADTKTGEQALQYVYFPSRSFAHYLEPLAIFAERVAPRIR